MLNNIQPCFYGSGGDYTCRSVESFHSKSDDITKGNNPDNYPVCKNTGCSEGLPCENASGCLNGLSCKDGVCTFERRFEYRPHDHEDRKEEKEKDEDEDEDKSWWSWWKSLFS